jgi:hypothetical protein
MALLNGDVYDAFLAAGVEDRLLDVLPRGLSTSFRSTPVDGRRTRGI